MNLTSMVCSNSSKLQFLSLFGLPDDLSITNDDWVALLSSALDSILLVEADDDDVAAISSMTSVVILLIIVWFVCLFMIIVVCTYLFV